MTEQSHRQWNGQQWMVWDGTQWLSESPVPVPPPPPEPVAAPVNDPYQQWNGQQWMRWDGTQWQPEQAAAPTPTIEPPAIVAAPPPGIPASIAPPPPGHGTPQPPPKKRHILCWSLVGGVAVLVIIGIVAAAVGSSSSSSVAAAPTPAAPVGTTPTESSPSPTVVAPSPTVAPPDPAAEARAAFVSTYGTFQPIVKSGRGDSIINLPSGITAGIATMAYKGADNFIVEPLDASNQSTIDTLANEIGHWSGSAAFGLSSLGTSATKIRVRATGAWSIVIAPVATAPVFKVPGAGKGSGVFLYVGDTADWTVRHLGSANFIVDQVTTDGATNNLINEIGHYSGTVPASAGPTVVTITADGAWTFK